jgi:hypothetical protein
MLLKLHGRQTGEQIMKTLLSLVVGLWLAGCASYSGGSLAPGAATQAEVRQLMGEPAAIHKGAAGQAVAEWWEYPRGPLGRHTYMARFDAGGRLLAIDQVLTVATTAKIAWGQATREDVRKMLGRPAGVYPVRTGGELWDYAALAADGSPRKIRIVVSFDTSGHAVSGGESYDWEEFNPNSGGGSTQ